jgi:DNA recombination protein RmuC
MTEPLPVGFTLLLVLLVAGVLACLFLLLRNRQQSAGGVTAVDLAVLEERLQGRDRELQQAENSQQQLRQQLQQAHHEALSLKEQVSRQETLLQQQRQQYEEKLAFLQNAEERLKLQFQQLAESILEQKGRHFSESSQKQLNDLLKPLGEKIQGFEKRVEETYDRESKQRFALEREIKALVEANARISTDADNLSKALRGESKTQGIWGEVILERVLEKSGLEKGREYEIQVSLQDADGGKGQPDVVVHLPEGKDVIIDSKVSLTAYQAYHAAEEDEARAAHLRQHLASIRAHVRGLSDKNYQHLAGVNTLDYVLMFLPVEAAFTLAVQQDDLLFTDAFAKNIILVGPSTLLATLRTIQSIWRYEHQNRNAQEIAEHAGRLYDKFADFVKDLEEIGQRLDKAQEAWGNAHNKLASGRGNLLNRTETLRKLGARNRKELPKNLLEAGSEDGDLED